MNHPPRADRPTLAIRRMKQDDVYEAILSEIQSGKLPVDSFLPSTRQLAKHFKSSLTPVNQAIRRLEGQGYVQSNHGSGVIVRASSTQEAIIRSRPVVEIITTFSGKLPGGISMPGFVPQHSLAAVQEWLIWALHEHSGLRVRTCNLTRQSIEAQLRAILQEALVFKPKVLALPFPEEFSSECYNYLRQLRAQGTHPVLRATRRDAPEFDRVQSDFRRGQRELTEHFLAAGRRELIRVSASPDLFYEQQKHQGFEDAFREAGRPVVHARQSTLVLQEDFITDNGEERIRFWVERLRQILKERPQLDAVMARSDFDAVTIKLALARLQHPGVEVAGYDDDWEERLGELEALFGRKEVAALGPPITVDTELAKFGTVMAELVAGRATDQLPPDQLQVRVVSQKLVLPN